MQCEAMHSLALAALMVGLSACKGGVGDDAAAGNAATGGGGEGANSPRGGADAGGESAGGGASLGALHHGDQVVIDGDFGTEDVVQTFLGGAGGRIEALREGDRIESGEGWFF